MNYDDIFPKISSIEIQTKSTLARVGAEFFWPSIKNDVKIFCKTCVPCQKVKAGKKQVNVGEFDVPDKRFSHLMVDIVGPLPESYGYRYLLTSIDRTTRFLNAWPLREASAAEAATAFLHGHVSLMGLPSVVTSDNGASFTAGLWKGMMDRLNVEVKYSALYRPESIGMLERQHRDLKSSLKAAIEDMVEKHQHKWLDFLPFVLLGKRVAHQPDIGASASQLTFGVNPRIPGQILSDPGEVENEESLQQLLSQVRNRTLLPAKQPSRHNRPEVPLAGLPEGVTQVFTKQHQTTGLQAPYEGPFEIHSQPSRSTVKLKVGKFKSGEDIFEIRHLNDLKFAHPESLAAPAQRPKRGRPSSHPGVPQSTEQQQSPPSRFQQPEKEPEPEPVDQPVEPSTRPQRSTRNPNPLYVDAITTGPPPLLGFPDKSQSAVRTAWTASQTELAEINNAIGRNRVRQAA